ncbi:MAG: GntR family transcriptional regulator [Deltaproteobacteria bacterium]|nr:GntR family transcriptional regulator [Deltaproteobacteria bacterium]
MPPIMPVYYQIKETINDWVISGEYGPGAKLPSENELAELFQVSRLTVRRAISLLIQEGLLHARRGEGTFVTSNQEFINSFSLEFSGFMDDLFYQISKSHPKTVQIERIKPSHYILEKLQLDEDTPEIVYIRRVRFLRDKSFAVTVNYLPVDIGSRFTAEDLFRRPLLKILEQDMGICFTEAFQTIEASFSNQQISEELGIPSGSPILYVERVMFTKGDRPVEFVQTSYRGDLYKYVVRLKRAKGRNGTMWVHEGN